MSKHRLFVPAVSFLLLTIPAAQAQLQIDASKITCQQYVLSKIADTRDIAAWLSGYYHGKADTPVVDIEELKNDAEKVKRYCQTNPQQLLVEAIATVTGHR